MYMRTVRSALGANASSLRVSVLYSRIGMTLIIGGPFPGRSLAGAPFPVWGTLSLRGKRPRRPPLGPTRVRNADVQVAGMRAEPDVAPRLPGCRARPQRGSELGPERLDRGALVADVHQDGACDVGQHPLEIWLIG